MQAQGSKHAAGARAVALALLLLPTAARAVEAAARSFQDYRALVVSGGSSLGVYEAGLLHAFTYVRAVAQELRPPSAEELRSRPAVVGGTSAGALNAFLTALALCQRPTPDPASSWFTLWLRLDWNDLLPAGGEGDPPVQFEGAASRRRIRELMDEVKARWVDSPEWVDCNVKLGAAVTYLVPRAEPLPGSSIKLARSTERFLVSFTGTAGHRPTIRVLPQLAGSARRYPVLGRDHPDMGEGERSIEELFPLLLASAGIPIIFDPVTLEVTYPGGGVEAQTFIDGGAFDNVPLSTVVRLLEAERRPGEEPGRIVYVDADNVTWEVPAVRPPTRGGIEGYLGLVQAQVAGARQAELVRALDAADWLGRALRLPRRHHLITGEMLGAFGAFFDQSFRRFDFVAGVADAEVSLEELGPWLETLREAGKLAALDAAIPELPCFRRAWEPTAQGRGGEEEVARALASPECLALRDAPGEDDEARTRRDEWRLLRALLTQPPTERRLSHAFYARLDAAPALPGRRRGYEWVTLRSGAKRAGPTQGEEAIRDQLQRLIGAVARNNDDDNVLYRSVLASAGIELADAALFPRRPPWMLSFGLYDGGLEVEASRTLGVLQLAGGLQLGSGAFSEHQGRNGFADTRVAGGLRADVRLLSGVQLRPGLYLTGQGLFIVHQHPVYRLGVTGRLDVDLVKRVYAAVGMTRFLAHERGWPTWDPGIGAGVRLWW